MEQFDWPVSRHSNFYRRIRGQFVHVTSEAGLKGIFLAGKLLPNLDGSFAAEGKENRCYYCKSIRAFSLLDFVYTDENQLFTANCFGDRNWANVFLYHHPGPAYALCLNLCGLETALELLHRKSFSELNSAERGTFIHEAEACFVGELSASRIEKVIEIDSKNDRFMEWDAKELKSRIRGSC